MTRSLRIAAVFGSVMALAVVSAGCGSTPTTAPTLKSTPASHAAMAEEEKEIAAELAKLPAEDRKLAEEQKVCPVTGEPLGSMGKPIKLTVKDRPVFICCASCEGKIKADPDKYLAKIGQN